MASPIIRQSASYRQGLVLGFTMAEIMLLLLFCLLIAMATFLRTEQAKRQEVEDRLEQEQLAGTADRQLVEAIRRDPRLAELLKRDTASINQTAVDEFWRELVESRAIVAAAKRGGLSTAELRDRLADLNTLKDKGISVDKAIRDAAIAASVVKAISRSPPATPRQVAEIIERGLKPQGSSGHKWPPIIKLSGANNFRSGSAELSAEFREALLDSIPRRIAQYINDYDVDVIEVVGHTDEQPVGGRDSNLDYNLLPVLRGASSVGSLLPADNAGLGLARAVSVVSVLRQSGLLTSFKMLPLSGAQLINTDESLALAGSPGDIGERRRIEIRLRKATPADTSMQSVASPPVTVPPPPRPKPKPAASAPVHAPPNGAIAPRMGWRPFEPSRPW
jgi:flagellar motor protein MotB